MPSDKEQKKIARRRGGREEIFFFTRKDKKGKQGSRETLIKQFIRIAIYGLILGMFACLGFFALKPWMQQWFAGNAKTVMIPEDEQAAEDSEKNQEGKEDPALDAESYEEMTPVEVNVIKRTRKVLFLYLLYLKRQTGTER